MAGGAQPSDTVKRLPKVVAVALLDDPDMQRHPHPEALNRSPCFGRERALGRDGRLQRSGRRGEDRLNGIANGLDDMATIRIDRLAQQLVMARERALHRLGLALPAGGAAGDIGEQKRQCTAGERTFVARRTSLAEDIGELGDQRVRVGVARGLQEAREPGAAEVAAAHGRLGQDLDDERLSWQVAGLVALDGRAGHADLLAQFILDRRGGLALVSGDAVDRPLEQAAKGFAAVAHDTLLWLREVAGVAVTIGFSMRSASLRVTLPA